MKNKPLYLDNAATSFPKPEAIYGQMAEVLKEYGACPGRGSYGMARKAEAIIREVRQLLADLLAIEDANRIILTFNATDALNMAIKGVCQAGDHVVTTLMEHNSVRRPLNQLEADGRIRVTRVMATPEGWVDPQVIIHSMRPNTRLVVMAHASNVSGTLQDIDRVGEAVRNTQAVFLVDAAQTAGSYPLSVERSAIDLLAIPGHKGLMGPQGTGALYVGPRVKLTPWREGGTGVFSEDLLQPKQFPYYLEAGSPNTWGMALWAQSLRFIKDLSIKKVRQHKVEVMKTLLRCISEWNEVKLCGPKDPSQRVGVFSLSCGKRPPCELAAELDAEFDIAVRAGLHCAPDAHRCLGTFPQGTLRISPGYFTQLDEIAQFSQAMQTILKNNALNNEVLHQL